ncbi:DUF2971 domain-containing protein [Abiotrophia defectiva]
MNEVRLKLSDETYEVWKESQEANKYSKYGENTFVLFPDEWNDYGYSVRYRLILMGPSIKKEMQYVYIGSTRIANKDMPEPEDSFSKEIDDCRKSKSYLDRILAPGKSDENKAKEDSLTLGEDFYSFSGEGEFYEKLIEIFSTPFCNNDSKQNDAYDLLDKLLTDMRDLTTLPRKDFDEVVKTKLFDKVMLREKTEFQSIVQELTKEKNKVDVSEGTFNYIMNLSRDTPREVLSVIEKHIEYKLFALSFISYCRKNSVVDDNRKTLDRIKNEHSQDKEIVKAVDNLMNPNNAIADTVNKIKKILIKEDIDDLLQKIRLGHYTSVETIQHLFKVDKGGENEATLRLTNSRQMNDPNEGLLLWEYFLGEGQDKEGYVLSDIYISCATSDCDNLVMWNQYADNSTGIMLEYEQQFLREVIEKTALKVGQVCYVEIVDDEVKQTSIEGVTDLLKELKEQAKNVDRTTLRQLLGSIIYLFKDYSYSHEKEYRIFGEYREGIKSEFSNKGIKLHKKIDKVALRYSRVVLGPRAMDIDYIAPYLKLCEPKIKIERSKINFR